MNNDFEDPEVKPCRNEGVEEVHRQVELTCWCDLTRFELYDAGDV